MKIDFNKIPKFIPSPIFMSNSEAKKYFENIILKLYDIETLIEKENIQKLTDTYASATMEWDYEKAKKEVLFAIYKRIIESLKIYFKENNIVFKPNEVVHVDLNTIETTFSEYKLLLSKSQMFYNYINKEMVETFKGITCNYTTINNNKESHISSIYVGNTLIASIDKKLTEKEIREYVAEYLGQVYNNQNKGEKMPIEMKQTTQLKVGDKVKIKGTISQFTIDQITQDGDETWFIDKDGNNYLEKELEIMTQKKPKVTKIKP